MKKLLILFFWTLSFLTFFASGIVESQDGLQYLTIARQIYYHQTFEMPAAKYPDENIHMNVNIGSNGGDYSPTGLGYSLAYLPAVAVEDFVNQLAGIQPTENFPLDNDWPIMLAASMTNAFFGALFMVVFFQFLISLKFSEKQALLLTVVLFFSSNLLVYAKHGFAHMMFVSFLWLSFFGIRKYGLSKKRMWLIAATISYGVVLLSYNPTYLLPLPALGLYYLFQLNWSEYRRSLVRLGNDLVVAVLSLAPFLLMYSWFNSVRFGGVVSTGYGSGGIAVPSLPPAFVLFEGMWGLLFSPGKSIFLFTPVLLVLILFWFKFKRKYIPELVAGVALSGVYFYFIASLVGGADFFPWHGEASFGPRYMLPILPFALLFVALIHREMSKVQRFVVFWPLVVVGIGIQLIGVLIPYQVRFSGMEHEIQLNGHRLTTSEYGNFIPRFSPLYSMGKWAARKTLEIPDFYFNKPEVSVADGAHGIIKTADGPWRPLETQSVFFVSPHADSKTVEIIVQNQVASTSAALYPLVLTAKTATDQLATATAEPNNAAVLELNNLAPSRDKIPITLSASYEGTSSAKPSSHEIFLTGIRDNGQLVSINNISYPYVSRVSKELFGAEYYFWGNENTKRWDLWQMRAIPFVHTFDLWWLRPMHYWDLPSNVFLVIFIMNSVIFASTSYGLWKMLGLGRVQKVR